jgi:hypothetical protein
MAVFPDCKIIFVLRDGRPVVSAMLDKIRMRNSPESAPMGEYCRPPGFEEMLDEDLVKQTCRQWLGIIDTFRRDAALLPPGRVHHVRSEELFEKPGPTLAGVWDYCQLPPTPDLLSTLAPRLTGGAGCWETERSPEEIATMTRLLGPTLRELGYVD